MSLNSINVLVHVLQKVKAIMHNDAATNAALVFILLQKETIYIQLIIKPRIW